MRWLKYASLIGLLLVTVSMALAQDSDDGYWDTTIATASGGFDGPVSELVSTGDLLIAGGEFETMGETNVNHIARYDGAGWSPLGAGFSQAPCLTVQGNRVIAAVPWNYWNESPWLWNGNVWDHIFGVYDCIDACGQTIPRRLGTFNDRLFISGKFVPPWGLEFPEPHGFLWSPGEIPWRDDLWFQESESIIAFLAVGLRLFVGGSFDSLLVHYSYWIHANNVATWSDSAWTPLSSGLNGPMYALAFYAGKVTAGGAFSEAGGMSAHNIAAWDGTSWSPLGTGVDGTVKTLVVHNGKLFAAGDFSLAGDKPAFNIAMWDGSGWSALGSGTSGAVLTMVSWNDRLVIGGTFQAAGAKVSPYIASWNKPCCFGSTGNTDCDPTDGVDISDLSALIDNLYINFTPLCCPKEANVDGQAGIDISDLSALIDYLYITFTPTAACQ